MPGLYKISNYKLIIVQVVNSSTMLYQVANRHVALVLDCLLAKTQKLLAQLGSYPQWYVTKDYICFELISKPTVCPAH